MGLNVPIARTTDNIIALTFTDFYEIIVLFFCKETNRKLLEIHLQDSSNTMRVSPFLIFHVHWFRICQNIQDNLWLNLHFKKEMVGQVNITDYKTAFLHSDSLYFQLCGIEDTVFIQVRNDTIFSNQGSSKMIIKNFM